LATQPENTRTLILEKRLVDNWTTIETYQGPCKIYEWPGYSAPEMNIIVGDGESVIVQQTPGPEDVPEQDNIAIRQRWVYMPQETVIWERFQQSLNQTPHNCAPRGWKW